MIARIYLVWLLAVVEWYVLHAGLFKCYGMLNLEQATGGKCRPSNEFELFNARSDCIIGRSYRVIGMSVRVQGSSNRIGGPAPVDFQN